MGFTSNVGKYQLGRTIGEGTFAKVKLAVDTISGQCVAIKIIDKCMVMENNLNHQVQREIRTMKLLDHPNIVKIHEVIATKTKIYIVMEYVSGGQLSDKLCYAKKLNETDARQIFQQLIDAVDYCHNKGVYHRDLKPENLLIDSKGKLKVSDFGLSTLRKPGEMLRTACGSPCYVAPELIENKGHDGAPADVWSCGISRADHTWPPWFTKDQKKLISRIFDPNPKTRITIPEIIEDEWFQKDYVPSFGYECNDKICLDDLSAAFDSLEEHGTDKNMPKSPTFINAFQLIAMSHDLDLSGLFEEQDDKQRTRLGSKNTAHETIKKIEAAATNASLSVEKMNNFKMKIHQKQRMFRSSRNYCNLSAEVIEVTPTNCVVEISKSAGELMVYKEFCKSLSSLLKEE
ncbi:CBL-interacting serine/threonine-protein kinase 21 isoform X2 [Carica papaya]|uniref:CBL-interacting serine/threonine-protein kinase 21 isoform X2 n=1 Tax=Carica papaya TaxID=3649 RepID=UPI000B8D023E|nr:CBL-interacting serine/threonine-protein kinase 21 isoform X2 [Carica papaya]